MFDPRRFPDLKFVVTCSLSRNRFNVTVQSPIIWFLFFRTRFGSSPFHDFPSSLRYLDGQSVSSNLFPQMSKLFSSSFDVRPLHFILFIFPIVNRWSPLPPSDVSTIYNHSVFQSQQTESHLNVHYASPFTKRRLLMGFALFAVSTRKKHGNNGPKKISARWLLMTVATTPRCSKISIRC